MKHLFLDLDGVFADFERGYEIMYGHHPHTKNDKDMWKTINGNPRHWDSLPLMMGAMRLWAVVKPLKPTILTGCPSGGYRQASIGKHNWCAREFGSDVPVITCMSRDKQKHMTSEGDVLIDDMTKNCKRWTEAGGLAIHHTSIETTIKTLEKMIEEGYFL